jgi:hypothetical protein
MAETAIKPTNPITSQAQIASAPTTIPKVKDSLKAVQDTIATLTSERVTNIEAMKADRQQLDSAAGAIQKNIADVTSSLQTIGIVKDNANMLAQNNTIEAFDLAGGSDSQKALMEQLGKQQAQSRSYMDELSNRMQATPTGIQIVDEIVNAFSTIQLQTQLDFSEQKEANLQADIANISNSTESINKAQLLTRKLINDDTIAANYAMLGAEGNIKAAEAEIANIHSNAEGMGRVMAAGNDLLNANLALYRSEGEEENRVLTKERHAHARVEMEFAKEKWLVQLPTMETNLEAAVEALRVAKATNPTAIPAAIAKHASVLKQFNDQVATEATLVRSIQAAQSMAGAVIEDKETIIFGLQQPAGSPSGAKYNKLLDIGVNPAGTLGDTPFSAIQNLNTISPSGNIAPTPVTSVLKDVLKLQADAFALEPLTIPKTEEGLAADFNDRAKAHMIAKAANIKAGDSTNPYQAPPMAVLKDIPAVADSILYKNVLAAMQMQEMNPQKVIDAAIDGMQAGRVSPEQAASGIVTIFNAAAGHNNEDMGGFRRFGLPSQVSYNTTLTKPATSFDELRTAGGLVLPTLSFAATSLIDNKSAVTNLAKSMASANDFLDVSVNLMDRAKVMNMLVKFRSSQKPTAPTTPTANNNK